MAQARVLDVLKLRQNENHSEEKSINELKESLDHQESDLLVEDMGQDEDDKIRSMIDNLVAASQNEMEDNNTDTDNLLKDMQGAIERLSLWQQMKDADLENYRSSLEKEKTESHSIILDDNERSKLLAKSSEEVRNEIEAIRAKMAKLRGGCHASKLEIPSVSTPRQEDSDICDLYEARNSLKEKTSKMEEGVINDLANMVELSNNVESYSENLNALLKQM